MAINELKQPLSAYQSLGNPTNITPIEIGLINKTYLVTTHKLKFIFQELSPIFNPVVNFDSDAVSQHLHKSAILSPRIHKTDDNQLFYAHDNKSFRALYYIEGTSFNTCTPVMAQSAGLVLGQFHQALLDFAYVYRSHRRSAGDYAFHQDYLVQALVKHADHDFFAQASKLSQLMINDMAAIKLHPAGVLRHIHGDPKISNMMFEGTTAKCLVDFDTLQLGSWSLEMADALRSWCNPHKEDNLDAHVDLNIAEAALAGYAQAQCPFTKEDAENLSAHSQAISLCLSMRYLADTLCENYFSFDQTRFARSCEHNWIRAQAMYQLSRDFLHKNSKLLAMINDYLLASPQ